jgi:hypothetical protein
MKQLNGFTATSYKPDEWVSLIKESGAKYAGLIFIDVPDAVLDEYITVLAVVLDGKLEIQK